MCGEVIGYTYAMGGIADGMSVWEGMRWHGYYIYSEERGRDIFSNERGYLICSCHVCELYCDFCLFYPHIDTGFINSCFAKK